MTVEITANFKSLSITPPLVNKLITLSQRSIKYCRIFRHDYAAPLTITQSPYALMIQYENSDVK